MKIERDEWIVFAVARGVFSHARAARNSAPRFRRVPIAGGDPVDKKLIVASSRDRIEAARLVEQFNSKETKA